jgi:hypothetical protein
MKIVLKDNFNRESVADFLVADRVNQYFGEIIVKHLNAIASDSEYFALEADDYELWRGMAKIVGDFDPIADTTTTTDFPQLLQLLGFNADDSAENVGNLANLSSFPASEVRKLE